jgi:ribosome maturation factor RimP
MIDRELIKKTVTDKLQNTDYYLIDVVISEDNDIKVEIDNDGGVSIDDCAMLSRYIEEQFDREAEDYSLEVGSSGITEPFKVLRQYRKNIGNEVEMMLKSGKKLTGILEDATEETVTIAVKHKEQKKSAKETAVMLLHLTYKYEDIKYTKYIIKF